MKNIILVSSLVALVLGGIALKQLTTTKGTAKYTIGILQTASHPALDACKDSFIQELKNKVGDNVAIETHNAQGSITQAHAIAQQLAANKQMDLYYTIATPAAQAMSSLEKERPIVIAAVTDPYALGLVHKDSNVCGVTDMIDVKAEIDMLIELVPQAHTVGLLYTSGEPNSIAMVQKMRTLLEERGLIAMDYAVSSETDIPAMVELACRKADVLLAPTDNTIASTISVITAITHKYKKPLIVSHNEAVSCGALASRGVDYQACGTRAAQIVYELLVEKKKPVDLPVEQPNSNKIVINKTTLDHVGVTIPSTLESNILFVE